MRVAVVPSAGADYQIEDRPTPEPEADEVRIRVHACGFCHSDENIRNGWIGNAFPRVPGHELAGVIEAKGAAVPDEWSVGDRVGVGWHGGHCQHCERCRAGDFKRCPQRAGCGSSFDGGFASHALVPHSGLSRLPQQMTFEDAGPLMCGGVTVYNALRKSGARWGDRVAIQGIGGLGHMAVQFASKMGFETIAISRGADKQSLAAQLGADHFIDAAAQDVGAALKQLGGVRAVIATAPSGASMAPLLAGLGPDGRLVVVGVSSEEIATPAYAFLDNDKGIHGSVIGTPYEVEECLRFAALKGIRPRIETFPLEQVAAAQERLLANQLRFRAVLTMPNDS